VVEEITGARSLKGATSIGGREKIGNVSAKYSGGGPPGYV
jgi:hypothetical protein